MTNTWQLQEAKNKFSEVVRCAERHGPQFITVRGHEAVVVLSVRDYERSEKPKPLRQRPDESILDWLKRSGAWATGVDVDLDLDHDRNDVGRDIDLSDL